MEARRTRVLVVGAGHAYNVWLKATWWSWLPYASAFGTLPTVVTLAGPSAPFISTLAMPGASIVSKAAMESMGEEAFAEKPDTIKDILFEGSRRARKVAEQTMTEVRAAVQLQP